MVTGDYWKKAPLADANLGIKDVSCALGLGGGDGCEAAELGNSAGVPAGCVVEHSGAKGGIAGVYGVVRQNSGLKFENDA